MIVRSFLHECSIGQLLWCTNDLVKTVSVEKIKESAKQSKLRRRRRQRRHRTNLLFNFELLWFGFFYLPFIRNVRDKPKKEENLKNDSFCLSLNHN